MVWSLGLGSGLYLDWCACQSWAKHSHSCLSLQEPRPPPTSPALQRWLFPMATEGHVWRRWDPHDLRGREAGQSMPDISSQLWACGHALQRARCQRWWKCRKLCRNGTGDLVVSQMFYYMFHTKKSCSLIFIILFINISCLNISLIWKI